MTPSPALALVLMLFGPAAPAPQGGDAAAAAPAKASPATPAAAADAPGASFETLGTGAVRTRDIGTLLSSFVDRCEVEKRDIDRARCAATTAYLRHTLP